MRIDITGWSQEKKDKFKKDFSKLGTFVPDISFGRIWLVLQPLLTKLKRNKK